jgi:hypothetical protein
MGETLNRLIDYFIASSVRKIISPHYGTRCHPVCVETNVTKVHQHTSKALHGVPIMPIGTPCKACKNQSVPKKLLDHLMAEWLILVAVIT